jgi:NAD(P)-dependent dehydrogenase (short-subunit alcohol dehydrogenase family)/catechol 2,3-dioxygenase-like lactoylglutathione lyase family enzyme
MATGCFSQFASLFTSSSQQHKDRYVLVTGCDSGFGQSLVLRLKKMDYNVIAACYTQDGAARFSGEGIVTVVADLSTAHGVDEVAATVLKAATPKDGAGEAELYGLVNNAGICLPGNVEWLSPDAYKTTMDLNFHAPVALTYKLLPLLKAARGRVMNVTSVDGFISLPTNPAYCASKHALEAFSDVLRAEMLPWGVKVVVVQPATMRTPLAMSYADGWLKSFQDAPADRRAVYGEMWAKAHHANVKKGLEDIAADPEVTVKAMVRALDYQNRNPPTRLATGKAAFWLFKPLSRLPDKMRDTFLYNALLKGTVQPAGLCKPSAPPTDVISHITIRVSKLHRAVEFYEKFGLTPVSPAVHGKQFLSGAPAVKENWPTLVLLHEDKEMATPREPSYHAGMTRLCIYSMDVNAEAARLRESGLEPMAPVTEDNVAKIAAYKDPDGFVVYYIQFKNAIGWAMRFFNRKKLDPVMFHWTINVNDIWAAKEVFSALGFKKMTDQNSDQVAYDLLPAFGIEPSTSAIKHIRLCKLPADNFVATLMQWVKPKSEMNGDEVVNSMTVAVKDVDAALKKARAAGMTIAGPVAKKTLPLYGEVRAVTAYVESNCNPIEFCCFDSVEEDDEICCFDSVGKDDKAPKVHDEIHETSMGA